MNPDTPNSATEPVPTVTEWKMPEWMEPYRDSFTNTGGNTVEELVNDLRTDKRMMTTNVVRFTLAVAVEAQVGLLNRLHKDGVI